MLTVIGEEAVKASDGFSTDRYCPTCKETMHWTKFHLEQNMCAECYRATLSNTVELMPQAGRKKKATKYTMRDLVADIDTMLNK